MPRVYAGRLSRSPAAGARMTEQKGTIEWLSSVGAWLVPETGEDVEEADLDRQGRCVSAPSERPRRQQRNEQKPQAARPH
jgi:hypothetical protein